MGCCWLLFLILIPLGVMNIAAMAAVAALVFVEKVTPWGKPAAMVACADPDRRRPRRDALAPSLPTVA